MRYEVSNIHKVIEDELKDAAQLEAPVFAQVKNPQLVAEAGPRVLRRLGDIRRSNRPMINLAMILLCAIFAVGLTLAIYHRDSPSNLSITLGGNFLSLLAVIAWLRRLWLETTTLDALITLAELMPPKEAAALIISFHFHAIQTKASLGDFAKNKTISSN